MVKNFSSGLVDEPERLTSNLSSSFGKRLYQPGRPWSLIGEGQEARQQSKGFGQRTEVSPQRCTADHAPRQPGTKRGGRKRSYLCILVCSAVQHGTTLNLHRGRRSPFRQETVRMLTIPCQHRVIIHLLHNFGSNHIGSPGIATGRQTLLGQPPLIGTYWTLTRGKL